MNQVSDVARTASRMGTLLGVLTLMLGLFCIGSPMVPGLALAIVIAVLMIGAGITQISFAFVAGSFGRGLFAFLFGGITILAGIVVLVRPMVGLGTLTMVLIAYLLVDGISTLNAAIRLRPQPGWIWILVSGVATLVLAWFLVRELPDAGAWAIGILIGVRLVIAGFSMIMLGLATGQVIKNLDRA